MQCSMELMFLPANLTERFRLDPTDARLLRRLARERKTTKSAVLREGLHRLAADQERLKRRQGAIDYLLAMADAVPGRADDTRWPLRA
jgi:hypothetical protein